jgi:hypothetical protein
MFLIIILAGLLTFAFCTFPFSQWLFTETFIAIYSCGDSPGVSPDSLFIPKYWKPKFLQR